MNPYVVLVGIALLIALLWTVDRNGYNRCQAKQTAAVSDQKVGDAKAVGEIKEKAHLAKKERIIYVEKIRKIKSACATTSVPIDRADRVREFYSSQAGQ